MPPRRSSSPTLSAARSRASIPDPKFIPTGGNGFASLQDYLHIFCYKMQIVDHNGSLQFKKMFEKLYQTDWKPQAPERFGDIADLTSLSNIKVEETKKQVSAQGSKSAQTSSKAPANTTAKPTGAYRPPHAKGSAEVQDKLFGGLAPAGGEMSKMH